MIRDKLISRIYGYDPATERNTLIAFRQIEVKGFLDTGEYMQISNAGIPILEILSNIMQLGKSETHALVLDKKISYSDMLCVLGVFAQDCEVIRQRRR